MRNCSRDVKTIIHSDISEILVFSDSLPKCKRSIPCRRSARVLFLWYTMAIESTSESCHCCHLFLFIFCLCCSCFFSFFLLLNNTCFSCFFFFVAVDFSVFLRLFCFCGTGDFETISLIISIAFRCVSLFLFDSQLGLPQ